MKACGEPNAHLAPQTGSRKTAIVTRAKSVAYELLNRPLLRPLLKALVYAKFAFVRHCLPTVDYRDGLWIHRHADGVIVNTRPTFQTPKDMEERLRPIYLQMYTPKRGDVVVDIGAGIGQETWPLAKMVGPTGRVIAIEAHPETFRCLKMMCEANGLSNVTVAQTAILDREANVEISTTEKHQGATVVGLHKSKTVQVPGNTLDHILAAAGVSKVDFLKMNIEGAERFAILGMAKSIQNIEHLCICCHDFRAEINDEPEMRTRSVVLDFFKANGFDIKMIADDPAPWVRDHVYAHRVSGRQSVQKTSAMTK